MRESLGVPVEWVADKLGVQTRSAQRWESNPKTPPIEPAVELIFNAYEDVLAEANLIVDNAKDQPGPVRLYRYLNQRHIDQDKGQAANDVELHNATVRAAFDILFRLSRDVEIHIPEID